MALLTGGPAPASAPGPGPGAESDRPPSGPDARGQLLLTAALVMAVLFVVLALLLNSAIYTENLSARGSTGDGGHAALQLRADAKAATEETVRYVNRHHNATHASLRRNLSGSVDRWSDLSGRQAAATGGTANLSLRRVSEGAHVRQTVPGRNFTDARRAEEWTLVSGATAVREYRLAVNASGLAAPPANLTAENVTNSSAFRIEVTAGSDDWDVFLYRNGSATVGVVVVTPAETLSATCAATGDPVVLDLPNATVDGTHCDALTFFNNVSGSRTIAYAHAENATGTYSLLVDTGTSFENDTSYAEPGSGEGPYATERINAAAVQVTYTTATLHYRSTIPVRAGDPDG